MSRIKYIARELLPSASCHVHDGGVLGPVVVQLIGNGVDVVASDLKDAVEAIIGCPVRVEESADRSGYEYRRPASLPAALRDKLQGMVPSHDGDRAVWPCSARLDDGSLEPHLFVIESPPHFGYWEFDPEGGTGSARVVSVERLVDLWEAPDRLPVKFANRLYIRGESAMGAYLFTLMLADGRRVPCETDLSVDFIEWPPEVRPDLIVDIVPGSDYARFTVPRTVPPRDRAWCFCGGGLP